MRQFLAWLNRRFPEVLTVTRQDYTELRQEVADLNRFAQGVIALEQRIKNLENSQGFIASGKGSFKLER